METLRRLMELRPDLLEARYLNAYALVRDRRFAEAEAELGFIAARDSRGTFRGRIAELRNSIPALTGSPR
jgi:hypothetical protein